MKASAGLRLRRVAWRALFALGCGKGAAQSREQRGGAPAPSESAAGPGPPPPPRRAPRRRRSLQIRPAARCASKARPRSATLALASGAQLDGSEWVSLAKGASLTLKHTDSGRELALAGPALFRACRRGREQVLLAKGKVTVGSGMGSRPGAEVLIATPLGGVRYGDADFTLTLTDKQLSVEVRAGQVDVDSAQDAQSVAKAPARCTAETSCRCRSASPTRSR